jgi:starch-binding outer membrane protein, SusD/RagB family
MRVIGNFKTTSQLMSEKGWTVLDVIWYERRAEFAGEGDRWFDLVRSGRAADAFADSDPRKANYTNEDLYMPIPQHDIDITGGQLTAYPSNELFQ